MPKDLVTPDGLVVWTAAHSAYGRVLAVDADDAARQRYGAETARDSGAAGTATTIQSPFRLLGQVADEDADLCWTRFRCFDPETGRWLSPDPLGLEGGLNTFELGGAPVSVVDRLGLTVDGGSPHGYADIYHYPNEGDPFGHYSVAVTHGGETLHTHQVLTSHDRSTTTITTDPTRQPDKAVRVQLADAAGAQEYQRSMLGQELGPYDVRSNSCVDHVSEVLRAGGEDVPEGGSDSTNISKDWGSDGLCDVRLSR